MRDRGEQSLRPAPWLLGWFPLDLDRAGFRLVCTTGQDLRLGQERGYAVMVTDVRTGDVRVLKAAESGQFIGAAAFSPDGGSVAVVELRVHLTVGVFDLTTGAMRTLAWSPGHNSGRKDVSVAWSPDGQRIAIGYEGTEDDAAYADGEESFDVLAVVDSVTGEQLRRLEATWLSGEVNAWTPDGMLMVETELTEDLGPGIMRDTWIGGSAFGRTHARVPLTRSVSDGVSTLHWMNEDGSQGDPIVSWEGPGRVLTALD